MCMYEKTEAKRRNEGQVEMSSAQIDIVDAFEAADLAELDNGVLKGVKLLGLRSKNRRNYDTEGVRKSAPVALESARVYIDHPSDPTKPRSYSEAFGVVTAYEYREGKGHFGTLKFNPEHVLAKQFIWDVKNNPKGMGMSINGKIRQADRRDSRGDVVVEAIEEIRSVDLVTRPGTATGIFESEEDIMKIEDILGNEDLMKQLKAKIAPATESVDAKESEELKKRLADLTEELNQRKAAEEAQKTKSEVTASITKIFEGVELPAGTIDKIVECACQLKPESRKTMEEALSGLGPMLSREPEEHETEEEVKEEQGEKKPAPRVGGSKGKGSAAAFDLRSELGIKVKS